MKPNPNVLFKRLGEEMVLFNLDTDHFYELNGSAARFWELLNAGHDPADVSEKMLQEFEVDPQQLANEAETLLSSLRKEGLLTNDE
jgi:Coenzyme PQQ synthesis protein D (PqqD)